MIIECIPIIAFEVTSKIMGSVRKTSSDRWKKRKCVTEEYAFRDELRRCCELFQVDETIYLDIHIKMPKSYSEKKKRLLNNTKHEEKPDWDNIAKCIQDTLAKEDKKVYFGVVRKRWGYKNNIVIGKIKVLQDD
jgi:Holliday junction resolvase RusA-like endonuclease